MQNVLREIKTKDITFRAYDQQGSWAAKSIAKEVDAQYVIPDLMFEPGDVIIDIGAHVGIFSMYYALRHPELEIFSYEPTKRNYNNFVKSLEYNKIKNVNAHNLAVTVDGRDVSMFQPADNTGASSMIYNEALPFQDKTDAKSITLKNIFGSVLNSPFYNGNKKIKILKIDCEGAEYEILTGNMELLKDVDYVLGEFHHVPGKYNAYKLHAELTDVIGAERNKIQIIQTNTII